MDHVTTYLLTKSAIAKKDARIMAYPTPLDTDLVTEEPIKFVLLAEFDIDQGATLAYQYPYPTGTDEQ